MFVEVGDFQRLLKWFPVTDVELIIKEVYITADNNRVGVSVVEQDLVAAMSNGLAVVHCHADETTLDSTGA
jgi:hypothetical protein